MTQPKSLQDIKRTRKQRQFFGRGDQCKQFEDNLNLSIEDPRRVFIFNIYGQGGVGKTWLMNEYERIARCHEAAIAWLDEDVLTSVDALVSLSEQMHAFGYDFDHFKERHKAYLQKRRELEVDPEKPEGISGLLGNALVKSVYWGMKTTPAGIITEFIDPKMAGEQAGKTIDFLVRKITNKDEQRLILHPQELLSKEFIKDLSEKGNRNSIVWFVDTFEQSGQVLETWLLDMLEGKYGDLLLNMLFVIAGRDPLDTNRWIDNQAIMLSLELNPFTTDEIEEYLRSRGITEIKSIESIYDLTGGLPLLVNMLVMQEPQSFESSNNPTDTAVERFLLWIRDPEFRNVALNAALARVLDQDVLEQITSLENARALFEWLKTQPFVKHREGSGWYYHDLVREMMMRHQYENSQKEWRQVHGKLNEYYQQKCDALNEKVKSANSTKEYQTYAVEALYHRFCSDPTCEQSNAINSVVEALRVEGDFDLRCALALQQAEKDCEIKDDCWGGILVEGLRAFYENQDLVKNIRMYDKLLGFNGLRNDLLALIYWSRGYTSHELGKYKEAIADKTRAIELEPQNAVYFHSRGFSYKAAGQYEEAIADGNLAIELQPKNSEYYHSRGFFYFAAGQHEEAINDLTHAIMLEPQNAEYHHSRGVCYHSAGQYGEAIADKSRAIELEPRNALYFQQRGVSYYGAGQYEHSIVDITHAIELEPGNAGYYHSRGVSYDAMGRYKEAIADKSRAIELEPENAEYFDSRSLSNHAAGKYEEAITDVSQAITLEPGNVGYYYSRGASYHKAGRYEEAIADKSRAIELEPGNAGYYHSRGASYHKAGRYEEAIADKSRAIELEPENALYYQQRGVSYDAAGKYEEAIADKSQAIELEPQNASYYQQRGVSYRAAGQYKKAIEDGTYAIELEPLRVLNYRSRGKSYHAAERYEEAIADLTRAIELDPQDAYNYGERAESYKAMGQDEKAAADIAIAETLEKK